MLLIIGVPGCVTIPPKWRKKMKIHQVQLQLSSTRVSTLHVPNLGFRERWTSPMLLAWLLVPPGKAKLLLVPRGKAKRRTPSSRKRRCSNHSLGKTADKETRLETQSLSLHNLATSWISSCVQLISVDLSQEVKSPTATMYPSAISRSDLRRVINWILRKYRSRRQNKSRARGRQVLIRRLSRVLALFPSSSSHLLSPLATAAAVVQNEPVLNQWQCNVMRGFI